MWLAVALWGCGTTCEVNAPLDYAAEASWLCRPGKETHCWSSIPTRTVAEDGTLTSGALEAATDPGLACFVVYPTFDLRLAAGLHHDTTDVPRAEEWTRTHVGALRQVCDLYVPVYRQVLIGTYLGKKTNDKKAQCFESAYGDVAAAFARFVEEEPTRPFVLLGHSQGAQHLSRLMRERVETDADLLARMVVAYPLGWPVGTDGSTTGGSWQTIPTCTRADETGCAVAFRTFVEGETEPPAGRFAEGSTVACANPASPDRPDGTAVLRAFQIDAADALVDVPSEVPDDALVIWENAFEAQCGTSGLSVRWVRDDAPPLKLDQLALTTDNGAHILDVNMGIADIVEDIRRRAVSRD